MIISEFPSEHVVGGNIGLLIEYAGNVYSNDWDAQDGPSVQHYCFRFSVNPISVLGNTFEKDIVS